MSRPNDQFTVRAESDAYRGTCGESATACQHKFRPAFRNEADGRVELARLPNGNPAPMHLISALPREWALRCDEQGGVLQLVETVIAGFLREGRFYTRDEAAAVLPS